MQTSKPKSEKEEAPRTPSPDPITGKRKNQIDSQAKKKKKLNEAALEDIKKKVKEEVKAEIQDERLRERLDAIKVGTQLEKFTKELNVSSGDDDDDYEKPKQRITRRQTKK
jgi:hypothetical protein